MCKAMNNLLLTSFLIFFIAIPTFSQSTLAFVEKEELFNKALELFHKGEYAASRESFEDFLNYENSSLQAEDAAYYRALSALYLFHNDAEDLMLTFIN